MLDGRWERLDAHWYGWSFACDQFFLVLHQLSQPIARSANWRLLLVQGQFQPIERYRRHGRRSMPRHTAGECQRKLQMGIRDKRRVIKYFRHPTHVWVCPCERTGCQSCSRSTLVFHRKRTRRGSTVRAMHSIPSTLFQRYWLASRCELWRFVLGWARKLLQSRWRLWSV